MFSTLELSAARSLPAEPIVVRPRVLALHWMVIDRSANKDRIWTEAIPGHIQTDAQQLALSAEATPDSELHRYKIAEMVPRPWPVLRHPYTVPSLRVLCAPCVLYVHLPYGR